MGGGGGGGRGKGGSKKPTTKQNGCRPTPPPQGASTAHESNPPAWTNLLTHVYIYTQKAIPEGETQTHA